MNVEQLVIALERRAMDREKIVVVERAGRPDKLWEIGDALPDNRLMVLKLWTPPPVRRP